jgi:hypothetical protein
VLVAGCGVSPTPPPSSSLSRPPTPGPAGSADPNAPSGSAIADSAIAVDRDLLSLIPTSIDGVDITFDNETSTQIAADPSLARDVTGIAVSIAAVPGASDADDLAVVSVVRLRDPTSGEEWFRDWRDTYNEGACGQAGGVIGNAEAELGGRTVFIGSCRGGVRTYHTRIADGAVVVSVTALGARRLGEKLMAALR